MIDMDPCEIANFLANEFFIHQLAQLDGLQSGVPTRTTSTLTPTTLRNIEQTFYELVEETPSSVPCQAGFVPPLPTFSEHSLGSSGSNSSGSWQTPPPTNSEDSTSAMPQNENSRQTSRRNMGGRRPNKPSNLSPEEEEKRKLRRERNKQAAARCRKRRVDQTNELTDQVDALERDKKRLEQQIQQLQADKEDLEYCLDAHKQTCSMMKRSGAMGLALDHKSSVHMLGLLDKVKEEPADSLDGPPSPKRIMLSSAAASPELHTPSGNGVMPTLGGHKPNRPNSLNVPLTPSQQLRLGTKNIADIAGVPITTPSSGVMFNFESLMDGGTGLTPVAGPLMPNSSSSLNKHPLEVVTPSSEPSKLVSL